MKQRSAIMLLVITLVTCVGRAQQSNNVVIDSLNQVIETAEHDSTVVKALNTLAGEVQRTDREKFRELAEQIRDICLDNLEMDVNPQEARFYRKYVVKAYTTLGHYSAQNGYEKKAIEFYESALPFA